VPARGEPALPAVGAAQRLDGLLDERAVGGAALLALGVGQLGAVRAPLAMRERRAPFRLARGPAVRQTCGMGGERDLHVLLASLEPVLRPGSFVFATVPDESLLEGVPVDALVREDEGLTVVLPRERADALGLEYDYVAAWITLRVYSALDAVGLTSAIAETLADAGMSVNVLAGYHHDHLLVPADRGHEALGLLRRRSRASV
jgi:hypothetical protein